MDVSQDRLMVKRLNSLSQQGQSGSIGLVPSTHMKLIASCTSSLRGPMPLASMGTTYTPSYIYIILDKK